MARLGRGFSHVNHDVMKDSLARSRVRAFTPNMHDARTMGIRQPVGTGQIIRQD